jgi:hypothetical protein
VRRSPGFATLVLAGLALSAGSWCVAQEGAPPPPETTEDGAAPEAEEPQEEPADLGDEGISAPKQRKLGRYRIGPLYLTPSFRIGTIGFDSNVLYTPTDRRPDFVAAGGPGLELVLPIRGALRWRADGTVQYQYFARTVSQRRWTGAAVTGLVWDTPRTGFAIEGRYQKQQQRPSLEVDRRVLGSMQGVGVSLTRALVGRTRLLLTGEWARHDTDLGEEHLGVDLHAQLSRDETRLVADLDHGLTIKTSVAVTADYLQSRYRFAPLRDVDIIRLQAGLRTDATALISGRALAGAAEFRPLAAGLARKRMAIWDVDATLNISSKTHIGGAVRRDIGHSALALAGSLPSLLTDTYSVRISKDLFYNLNLEVFARRTRLVNEGRVVLVVGDETTTAEQRRDTADEIGADLGYNFRSRLRIGVAASYLERRSNVSYFGIDGLLVGLTVRVIPPRLL